MHSHELPADMVNELSTFVNLQFNTKEEHAEIVSAFPPVFRARIFRILYKPIIEQSYLVSCPSLSVACRTLASRTCKIPDRFPFELLSRTIPHSHLPSAVCSWTRSLMPFWTFWPVS